MCGCRECRWGSAGSRTPLGNPEESVTAGLTFAKEGPDEVKRHRRGALSPQSTAAATGDATVTVEVRTYSNVWDAIADSPEEASDLKLRSQLMDAIEAYILREGITQRVAADRLGVPRSRVSELVNGRISKFTIDKLVNMAGRVGLDVTMNVEESRGDGPMDDVAASS